MGENPDTVFVTGCPSIDLAAEMLINPTVRFDPIRKYGGVGDRVDLSNGYLVVLRHPVTTEHNLARKIGIRLRRHIRFRGAHGCSNFRQDQFA